MAWFKVDDGFATSPKVLSIPRAHRLAAVGLWTLAGTWCARHLTDGAVPAYMLDEWGSDVSLGTALVEAGLWRATSKGYQFHGWLEYQPSRAEVEDIREKERQRKQAYRDRKAGQSASGPAGTDGDVPAGQTVVSQGASGHPDPTPPDPTRPVKNTPSSPAGEGGFAEFYLAYPRKVGKEAARKAFVKATRTTPVEVIIAGARRFAADPNLPSDKNFIPHPSSWLNAGRWDDEPLPPRADGGGRPQLPDLGDGQEWMRR